MVCASEHHLKRLYRLFGIPFWKAAVEKLSDGTRMRVSVPLIQNVLLPDQPGVRTDGESGAVGGAGDSLLSASLRG